MKDINESSMSRIYQKLIDDSSCALISTYRSERSENENRKLLQELKQDVRVKFGFIEFIARWSEKLDDNKVVASDERSLLIPNISLAESMQLAKKYNQASFIYKDKEGCREICATKFESWDSNGKIYMPGEVVRTFNINRDDRTILNLEDAKEIFAKRKGGPASYLVKGGGQKAFHLSEVLEVFETRASYFHKQPLGYTTIFKEAFSDKDNQIISYIKEDYEVQSNVYFWSTFILPTGEFIKPTNENYDDDYEHANIIEGVAENCFDGNWMDAEEWLTQNCVKCNADFPYIAYPPKPTKKQYQAAEEYMECIAKNTGGFSINVDDYGKDSKTFRGNPVQIIIGNQDEVFSLLMNTPEDITKKVMRASVGGMLEESRMLEQGKLIIENIEINPGINPKVIKERPDWFFNVDRVKQQLEKLDIPKNITVVVKSFLSEGFVVEIYETLEDGVREIELWESSVIKADQLSGYQLNLIKKYFNNSNSNIDEGNIQGSLKEAADSSQALKLKEKSNAYAILYGWKYKNEPEVEIAPEEHSEESLKSRLNQIVKDYNKYSENNSRGNRYAYERDFIFYILYNDNKNSVEEALAPADYQPKVTGKAYKVFKVKNGKLYPPMVANPGGADTPVGVWLTADEGEFAGLSKTGRPQVKSTGSGNLAYRPGWHLGDIPLAQQFYRTNKETGEKEFPADFVWAECDYVMEIDYQDEATEQGYMRTKPDGTTYKSDKYQHSLAGLPRMPKDGYYRYRTNPNPDTVPWVITGAIKVNKLLSDEDVAKILSEKGIKVPNRQGGNKTLKELGL